MALTQFAASHRLLMDMVYPYVTRMAQSYLADWNSGISVCLWQILLIWMLMLILAGVACLSQNLVPVHITFIPILIPPMLSLFNELKIDRRATACSLAFGLKAPYISIPFGFGAIFMGIIADNMTTNGMEITVGEVAKYNWLLGACMLVGLLLAVFVGFVIMMVLDVALG